MIKVKLGTPSKRKDVITETDVTITQLFAENNFDISSALVSVNGATLNRESLNKTLDELSINDGAFLVSVVKADNA